MSVKIVDCIILAMLEEERALFLKHNNCFFYNPKMIHDEFLEFCYFDKDNHLRNGVFCSFDREMGNNEASKLFYKLSRKYQSDLCINIGVVGYISEVSIGDVIIVNDNYSLCEKNVANSALQKTDAVLDKQFIRNSVCTPLERHYASSFEKNSGDKLHDLRERLEQYIDETSLKDSLVKSLRRTCGHGLNKIKQGACATYHSVVKDEETRKAIKSFRKTNIVDMEAYYFNYWHQLIREEEYEDNLKNSKMIIFKSISDTAIEEEKAILEEIGSRDLAMSNICDVVTYYICNLYEYPCESREELSTYFTKEVSDKHIDKLIRHTPEGYETLERLCSYLIINNTINGISINGDYIKTVCDILKKNNQILVLEGNPGKGKSTFISYVYKKISQEQPAVFISIPELLTADGMTSEQALYLLERLLRSNKSIIVFVDGVEGSRQKKSEENKEVLDSLIMILNQYRGGNVSLCIGAWHTNDVNDIKKDILNKINAESEVNTLTFQSVSALDDKIDDFILKFAEFYKDTDANFNIDFYVEKVKGIVKNNELQLRYVDFRLLYIFAKYRQALNDSNNILDFIKAYCIAKASVKLDDVINHVAFVLKRTNETDSSGLLSKNIYSRAFLFSQFIYKSFIDNNEEMINSILSNKYILSDNINLFLEYTLNNNAARRREFVDNVLNGLNNHDDCQLCSEIQLLYNVSTVRNLTGKKKEMIKSYILEKIKELDMYDLPEQESDIIIGYRTLAIILNNKFGVSSYLEKFNKILSDTNKLSNADIVKRINRNFHLLYYSQTEFTYDRVEDNVMFELEVIGNTYRILKNSIISDQFNTAYIETCAITLLQLIQYIESDIFTEEELQECINLIKEVQEKYNLQCVKKLIE